MATKKATKNPLISRVDAFIKEAREVNKACSVLGHDDDSYDAGSLRDEAKELKKALASKDPKAVTRFIENSDIYEVADAEAWLAEAESRLDRLG